MKHLMTMIMALALAAPACGDDTPGNGNGDGYDGGDAQDGGDAYDGGDSRDGGDDGGVVDPCQGVNCPEHQHCEEGACVDNTCADLNCGPTEVCEELPGGGAICKDISCDQDIDCPEDQFCNGTICVDDMCEPGCRQCVGLVIQECTSNGSGFVAAYTCGSTAYFDSECIDDGLCNAWCTCEDDWDCPEWTVCEGGVCKGTGREPTCWLAPEPFTNVLPTQEITWGGVSEAEPDAVGSPFPRSAQVVISPIVANLDDDNGDGLINESDFPEIVFLTFHNSQYREDGVLRAIHGGGPNKGGDFFATCGTITWHEGDDINMACTYTNADLDSTSSLAVGDLDYDGVPEIVGVTETNGINIYSNTGELLSTNAGLNFAGANPAVALANVDNQGFAEIVIGRALFTVTDATGTLTVLDSFEGNGTYGRNGQGPASCVANLTGDERQEIVGGTVLYRWPDPPAGAASRADCTGLETDPDEVAWCAGDLVTVWDAAVVNGSVSVADGFCAIADILGVDPSIAPSPANPLDGKPEVLLIANGHIEIFDGETGVEYRDINLSMGSNGGPPNVDDFDGDGFFEIGTAFSSAYILHDFQDPSANCPAWPEVMVDDQPLPAGNPDRTPNGVACASDADCQAGEAVCNLKIGQCVCLHNGWFRQTEDNSSRVTGSSVFDFNGDGAAEVVYNDECYFRIYNGLDGKVFFKEPSESRTRIEYPIVTDVDNDGNAEIVFGTSNESGFCSEGAAYDYNDGIEVWGDAGDYWVSARRIWNQHTYHVTNILENGAIPLKEPESWKTYNGRRYNTYRSNPRQYNTAPDLTLTAMQFSSPDASCGSLGTLLNIVVQVENIGDVIVGPSLVIAFEGTWTNPAVTEPLLDDQGQPLQYVLQKPLEPGDAVFASVTYDSADNPQGTLPDSIRAIADAELRERECREDNNELTADVEPGEQAADLRVELGAHDDSACPDPTVETTVYNDGSLAAADIVVRYYAGDPDQGGTRIHEETVAGPLEPGTSTTFTASLYGFPLNRLITVYAVVDPDNQIFECNDGDNKAQGEQIICYEN